jgi:hypothetical protein
MDPNPYKSPQDCKPVHSGWVCLLAAAVLVAVGAAYIVAGFSVRLMGTIIFGIMFSAAGIAVLILRRRAA